jgi:hypothetical protein
VIFVPAKVIRCVLVDGGDEVVLTSVPAVDTALSCGVEISGSVDVFTIGTVAETQNVVSVFIWITTAALSSAEIASMLEPYVMPLMIYV